MQNFGYTGGAEDNFETRYLTAETFNDLELSAVSKSYNFKVMDSGRPEVVLFQKDGSIAEVHSNRFTGMPCTAYIFKNEDDFRSYSAPRGISRYEF